MQCKGFKEVVGFWVLIIPVHTKGYSRQQVSHVTCLPKASSGTDLPRVLSRQNFAYQRVENTGHYYYLIVTGLMDITSILETSANAYQLSPHH